MQQRWQQQQYLHKAIFTDNHVPEQPGCLCDVADTQQSCKTAQGTQASCLKTPPVVVPRIRAEPSALGEMELTGPDTDAKGRMSRHIWSLVNTVREPSPPPASSRPVDVRQMAPTPAPTLSKGQAFVLDESRHRLYTAASRRSA